MKLSIIIPTYNHFDDCLKPCISSVIKYSNYDMEITVVCNGCIDNTIPYLRELNNPQIKILEYKEAIGYTKAINRGIENSSGEYIILLNNDTVLLEQPVNQWIDMLLKPLKEDKSVAITGPMETHSPEAQDTFLIFFCVAMRKSLFTEIGLLDEIFSPGFGEDVDFAIKAKQKGYKILQVPDYNTHYNEPKRMTGVFPIYHKGEGTFADLKDGWNILTKNRLTLAKRYAKSLKLNLGCGNHIVPGYLNVDLYDDMADVKLDVTDLSEFDDNSVEEILAYHIFEHLNPYDCLKILKEWHRVLKPGGKLALEMPDTLEICKHFEEKDKDGRYKLINCLYGTAQSIEHGHKFGWYEEILVDHLQQVDFSNISRQPLKMDHHWGYNMRIEAHKPLLPTNYLPIQENKSSKPEIYDCFIFFNELETLDIRLNELDPVVDKFVLVESTRTHTNKPKPLYFAENKDKFAKFLHKIIHIIVDTFPDSTDSWAFERSQRDHILKALTNCKDTDVIIISDLDEIPKANTVKQLTNITEIKTLKQKLYYYYINCQEETPWEWCKILPYGILKKITPCEVRYTAAPVIEDGGWHFSFQGGIDRIIQKIESWPHQEYNTPEIKNPNRIYNVLKEGKDIFNRDLKFTIVNVDDSYPEYIQNNIPQFFNFIVDKKLTGNDVTVEISTKDRYFSTLPITIMSIINQTEKPKAIIIYDDGEHKDLRNEPLYQHIFNLLQEKNIQWTVNFGERKGQVHNHNKAIKDAQTPLIWRIDDDDEAEPQALENLLKHFTKETGAIGSLILLPGNNNYTSFSSAKIEDINGKPHLQWLKSQETKPIQADHLNNSFLFRKSAAKHGYCLNLSAAGHREETLLTFEMKRNGWQVLIDPTSIIYHLRSPEGGIRTYKPEDFQHDDNVFNEKLKQWNVTLNKYKLCVLNNGLGDHLAFKIILPEILEKYNDHKVVLFVCYPEVFTDSPVELLSINSFQSGNIEDFNVYAFMTKNNWQGKLVDAFRKLYI